MGWLWVAWALLAVAPAPIEPEARYGFPSGNISTIPDFPVTLDGLSRVVFRLDETSPHRIVRPGLRGKAVSRPIFLQLMALLDDYARTGVSALHS